MDFILGLPKAPIGEDSIWVVVDRLTKSAHFIPIKFKNSMNKLARLYVQNIVCLHGIPSVIISNRDSFYLEILAKSLEGNGDGAEVQYRFPSSDRQSV